MQEKREAESSAHETICLLAGHTMNILSCSVCHTQRDGIWIYSPKRASCSLSSVSCRCCVRQRWVDREIVWGNLMVGLNTRLSSSNWVRTQVILKSKHLDAEFSHSNTGQMLLHTCPREAFVLRRFLVLDAYVQDPKPRMVDCFIQRQVACQMM